ncbi:MAG TPA: hemerythrin domain-containing protein [Kofleriaceae bacterium]|nr:hemerythrin domain-containing protein [Kofleriaceae bacterium]
MATPRTPSHALAALSAQHADLRAQIARCEQLADELDAGAAEPAVLLEAITALRRTFDAHNQLEERWLHPLMIGTDWMGAVRVARMVEDHVEEHQAIRRAIAPELGSTTTAALRDVLAGLRDHLAAEERGFLSRRVLRDNLSE